MDDTRIKNIEGTVKRIEEALLGTFGENKTIGLLEEQRMQRRELDSIKKAQDDIAPKVEECMTFKRDVKKIVIGIGAIIPFIFEVLKLGGSAIWDYVFHTHGK